MALAFKSELSESKVNPFNNCALLPLQYYILSLPLSLCILQITLIMFVQPSYSISSSSSKIVFKDII